MEDSNKNNSINNEESGDKTKIVKTQNETMQLNQPNSLIMKPPLKIKMKQIQNCLKKKTLR